MGKSGKSNICLQVLISVITTILFCTVFLLSSCIGIVKPEEISEGRLKEGETTLQETEGKEVQEPEETEEEIGKEDEPESSGIEDTESEENQDVDSTLEAGSGRIYAAILKGVNLNNNTLEIEQLTNEPNEKEIGSEVRLTTDYKVYRIIVVKSESSEKEYTKKISLKEVPIGVEIGLSFSEESLVNKIIYSELMDASKDVIKVKADPLKGEYFAYAILKGIDVNKNTLDIEQLINEPNEKEIGTQVRLTQNYKVYRNILVRSTESEKEYTKEIPLGQVPIGSEIGIILTKDNLATVVIFQEIIENR